MYQSLERFLKRKETIPTTMEIIGTGWASAGVIDLVPQISEMWR